MWTVFSASAIGKRNLEQGAAGQDASHCVVTDDVLVAIVCDGAGSVREGRTGSDFIARTLAEQLSSALHADRDCHVQAEGARASRRPSAPRSRPSAPASQISLPRASSRSTIFHARCWDAWPHAGGGCFFHIGDGFAIQQGAAGDSVLSRPENGEYADETYFVTDENWQRPSSAHAASPRPSADA